MGEPAKPKTEWDEFLAGGDGSKTPALAPDIAKPISVAPGAAAPPKTEWDEFVDANGTQALLDENTGVMGAVRDFMKYSGHGAVRALANDIGMPVDAVNTVGSFLADNPNVSPFMAGPVLGAFADAAKTVIGSRGGKPIETMSGDSVRKAAGKIGLPTSTPKEDHVHSASAELGDVFGEFGLGSLPFVAGLPVKVAGKTISNAQKILRADRPITELLKEVGFGAFGPAGGAAIGAEVADKDNEEIGKSVGGILGGTRLLAAELAVKGGKKAGSWLRDFFGAGQIGAEKKVAEGIAGTASNLSEAQNKLQNLPQLVPGAKAELPVDIASGDLGIIALRRSNMADNAELVGDYKAKELAFAKSIEEYSKLSKTKETDPLVWFGTQQEALKSGAETALENAVRKAEQDTEHAFRDVVMNPTEATNAKNAYAANLRAHTAAARDDFDVVVQQFWKDVDKSVPVDMDGVYDTVKTLKAEHAGRPGQDPNRFPKEVFDRFFDENGAPKFGPDTRLQEVIDLDSAVQQSIREATAAEAPDATRISYLDRLSKALYKAKEQLPDATTNLPLKAALNATKTYHDTFTRGPVGHLLGYDTSGAPRVVPGDTVRHFLTQGPGNVDNFNSFMKALEKRTGAGQAPGQAAMPVEQMKPTLEKYLRQDFYDNVMPNGFNESAARKWMSNRAGALNHFPELQNDLEAMIKSRGESTQVGTQTKKTLEELRHNAAHLFLNGNAGPLFNGALKGPDQYGATKKLLELTKGDRSGKATEGLIQMAFDHMISTAKVGDLSVGSPFERLSGQHLLDWIKEHKGAIKALDEALPKTRTQQLAASSRRASSFQEPGVRRPSGVADRFDQIAETARYLEMFRVDPKIPAKQVKPITPLMEIMARYMGADIGAKLSSGGAGHGFQMAGLGSTVFKQIFEKLTPEKAGDILRRAMMDPVFFQQLTSGMTNLNAPQAFNALRPYFVSMGIPIVQPFITQPGEKGESGDKRSDGGGDFGRDGGGGPGEIVQPPANPARPGVMGKAAEAAGRYMAPNLMSLAAGDQPPPLQELAGQPGKTPSTDDPRIAGGVSEVGQLGLDVLSMTGPAGAASLGARVVEGLGSRLASGGARAAAPALIGAATVAAGDNEAAAKMTDRQKAAIEFKREQAKIDREQAAERAEEAKADAERKQKAAAQASDLEKQRLRAEADTARQKAEDASRIAVEQKEKEAHLETERQQQLAERSFREKFPQLSSAISNTGMMLSALFPLAARAKAVGPIKRMAEAWEGAAENAEKALKAKDMFQAKIYIDQMAAFKKEADKMEKAGKGYSAADKSSTLLNINAGMLPAEAGSVPEGLDLIYGEPKAKEKAKEKLLDPMRIPAALATGAVFTGLGAKAPLPGKKPDFEKLRALSEANVKSLKDLRASESRAKKKAPKSEESRAE